MHYVNIVLDWIEAHPTIFTLVILPIIGALVSWVGKPRTPEEFAKMPYVLAQLLRVWSAIFPDPNKVVKVIVEMLTRKKVDQDAPTKPKLPPDPPSGAGGALMAFAFVLSFALHGCGGVKAPTARDATRAGVELLATALPMANELCSKSTDRATLEKCAKAYDVGRPSLVAAAQLVDVWAGASENDKACALSASLKAVAAIVDAMRAGGLEVPDLIRDAVSFAAPLIGSCKSVTP